MYVFTNGKWKKSSSNASFSVYTMEGLPFGYSFDFVGSSVSCFVDCPTGWIYLMVYPWCSLTWFSVLFISHKLEVRNNLIKIGLKIGAGILPDDTSYFIRHRPAGAQCQVVLPTGVRADGLAG